MEALLLPHFNYCDAVMCDMDAESKKSLQVAMNGCIRFAYKMKRRDNVSMQESAILGCGYSNYKKYRLCLMLRKVLITKQPGYLFKLLTLTRSERNPSLVVPYAIRSILKDSFFVQAILLFNSLVLKRNVSSTAFPAMCLQYFS